jgi:hypothetical protein
MGPDTRARHVEGIERASGEALPVDHGSLCPSLQRLQQRGLLVADRSIGVRPLINGRGTYTIMSGPLMLPEVRARSMPHRAHDVRLVGLADASARVSPPSHSVSHDRALALATNWRNPGEAAFHAPRRRRA